MAEKYAVLIKYKYLEYVENANLSDADSWQLMKGIIKYDRDREIPIFSNPILTALFAIIKTDLDSNREKWEEKAIVNRENGKKGGRPRKIDKTHDNPKKAKKPGGLSETQNNPKNPEKHDSGSGYDLVSEFESGGGNDLENKEPPPPPFEQIKKEAGEQGFFIDSKIAREFVESGIDPSWLIGPYSFLEFAAVAVKAKYPDKPEDQQKAVYISAVKSWEDIRDPYPDWRKKQQQAAAKAARQEAERQAEEARKTEIEKARADNPKVCECGKPLDETLCCLGCKSQYVFDEHTLRYNRKEMSAFMYSIMRKKLARRDEQ